MSIKCQKCRGSEAVILTRFERVWAWLFDKVNYTFFADEFEDLKNAKYTQGFSDGNIEGFKQGAVERRITSMNDLWKGICEDNNPKDKYYDN